MKRIKPKTKSALKRRKRPKKYETKLKLNASFEEVVKLIVSGNPKSTKHKP